MDMFSALSDPSRRNILELLSQKGELSSTDISNKFTISPPAISQHLKVLKEANLVNVQVRAQQRIYTINTHAIHEIESWASKIGKKWDARFDKLDKVLSQMKKRGTN